MKSQYLWYTARASGLVTWALLATSLIWGLLLSTKALRGRTSPAWILDLHRFLGGTALIFLGIHITTISLDTYVNFGPLQLLIPLTAHWHPVAVMWGIVAMYLLVAVEVTSLLRNKLAPRLWRRLHVLAFPLFVLATIHALSAGTDRHRWWMTIPIWSVVGALSLATVIRALMVARKHWGAPPVRVVRSRETVARPS